MIGRRHDDGIDILVVEQFAVVAILGALFLGDAFDFLLRVGQMTRINIAQRDDIDSIEHLQKRAEVLPTAVAHADEAQANAVARRRRLWDCRKRAAKQLSAMQAQPRRLRLPLICEEIHVDFRAYQILLLCIV